MSEAINTQNTDGQNGNIARHIGYALYDLAVELKIYSNSTLAYFTCRMLPILVVTLGFRLTGFKCGMN